MNMDAITLEDCLIHFEINSQRAVINDGHVIDFEEDLSFKTSTSYVLIFRE